MFMFHSIQDLRETNKSTNVWCLFPSYKREHEEAKCLGTLTPTSTHTCLPLLLISPPPNPPCGQSQKLMLPGPFQKDVFETKCSVLLSPYLCLCFAKYHISADLFLGLGPFPMHCLLFTCFKNISTMQLLFSIHYIIV